jgi:predicted RNA binding protein YcfA (HicA-like mRNA interferase family)
VSPRLPRLTADDLLRALRHDGWEPRRQTGSHLIMGHATKRGIAVVPMHGARIVPVGTLRAILAAAELDGDDLRELL